MNVRLVASGAGVAIGAGAVVAPAGVSTRLTGRIPEVHVWPTTVPPIENYWAAGEVAMTVRAPQGLYSHLSRTDVQGAEQYEVQIENAWSTDGFTADLAVTVDWAIVEWRL